MPISTIGQNGLNAPLSLTSPALGTPSALVLTNATGLPKSALPTGSVLQVVQTSNNTLAAFLRNEYINQLTTSITPSATSSKILICVNFGGLSSDAAADCGIRLYRDTTEISAGLTATDTNAAFIPFMNQGSADCFSSSFMYLDSPATTSSTPYKFRCAINAGRTMYYNRRGGDQTYACTSSVILMEIAA
jgi:hypothetical protein